MENIRIFIWKLSVFGGEIVNIFESTYFRNDMQPIGRVGRIVQTYSDHPAHTQSIIQAFALHSYFL